MVIINLCMIFQFIIQVYSNKVELIMEEIVTVFEQYLGFKINNHEC